MGIGSSEFCFRRSLGSGYHRKVEPREFAVGLGVRGKRERSKYDITLVGLSNRKDCVIGRGKTMRGAGCLGGTEVGEGEGIAGSR